MVSHESVDSKDFSELAYCYENQSVLLTYSGTSVTLSLKDGYAIKAGQY